MPTFLHVGCGPKRKSQTTPGFNRPEWKELRFDIDETVKPDLVGDMTDMSAVASGSVDGVFSSHNLEHLYAYQAPIALAEFHRVLSPQGFAVVTCPDLQLVAQIVAEGRLLEPLYQSTMGPISAVDILYGHRASLAEGKHYMAHRHGFTLKTLFDALTEAGFAKVKARRRRTHLELWAVAAKSRMPNAELEALAEAHFPPLTPPAAAPSRPE